MPKEVIKFLAPHADENFIDATCGLGGHSRLILEKTAPKGQLLAIDQDIVALNQARKNLAQFQARITWAHANFAELGLIIKDWPVKKINGILFDLGVSTYQLTAPERGFSFNAPAKLDMRMAPESQRLTAGDIVNQWDAHSLKRILKNFGEEPFAAKIAREIIRVRQNRPIETTDELVAVIKRALPPSYRASREKHFATATFRALRMAVNNELAVLENGLKQALQVLSPGGRIVVIAFHSLEDRIVKNFFRENENRPANRQGLKILTEKPVTASAEEIKTNPKARSAKLRAAVKNKF